MYITDLRDLKIGRGKAHGCECFKCSPCQSLADVSRRLFTVRSLLNFDSFGHLLEVLQLLLESTGLSLHFAGVSTHLLELFASSILAFLIFSLTWGCFLFRQLIQSSSNVLTLYLIPKSYKALAIVELLADD